MMFLLLACERVTCTTEFRTSVTINLSSEVGAAIEGATVSFVLDGADPEPCEEWSGGSYACGGEQAGEFVITIEAPGYETFVTDPVVVGHDECHVESEALDVVLTQLQCAEDAAKPSVYLTVLDIQDGELSGVQAWYSVDGGAESECSGTNDLWACGVEEAGEITVRAIADAHEEQSQTVTVTQGECHVNTQSVTLTLNYLPD